MRTLTHIFLTTLLLSLGQLAVANPDLNQRTIDQLRSLRARVEKGIYDDGIAGVAELKQILLTSEHSDLRKFADRMQGTSGTFARDYVFQMAEQAIQMLNPTFTDPTASLVALNRKAKTGPVTSDDLVEFKKIVLGLKRREFDLLATGASDVSGMFAQTFLLEATSMVIAALSPNNGRPFGRTCQPRL